MPLVADRRGSTRREQRGNDDLIRPMTPAALNETSAGFRPSAPLAVSAATRTHFLWG